MKENDIDKLNKEIEKLEKDIETKNDRILELETVVQKMVDLADDITRIKY